jgi:hypothetical protein
MRGPGAKHHYESWAGRGPSSSSFGAPVFPLRLVRSGLRFQTTPCSTEKKCVDAGEASRHVSRHPDLIINHHSVPYPCSCSLMAREGASPVLYVRRGCPRVGERRANRFRYAPINICPTIQPHNIIAIPSSFGLRSPPAPNLVAPLCDAAASAPAASNQAR